MKLTAAEIEAGKSARGGWTRAQLAQWGVPWPPPKGWKRALLGQLADGPATPKQIAYLEFLCRRAGEPLLPDDMTIKQASQEIDRLKKALR
jgi:hypothetical protein